MDLHNADYLCRRTNGNFRGAKAWFERQTTSSTYNDSMGLFRLAIVSLTFLILIRTNHVTSFCCFHLFKAPLLNTPPKEPLPDPSTSSNWYGEICIRYPRSNQILPVNFGATFRAVSKFRTIMNEVALHTFGTDAQELSLSHALDYRKQLATWYDELPDQLSAKRIVLPCQLKMQ